MNPARRLLSHAVHAGWRWLDRAGEIVPGSKAAEAFGAFGPGSCIGFPPATLLNVGSIHIGSGTLVGRDATLSVGYGVGDLQAGSRALVIGDRCVLGARTTITAHERIEIGDAVFCGQGVFITDSSHGYQDPELPIGEQLGAHRPVVIGSGTWIGHAAVVLPGSRIGRNVVVAAGAVVHGDVEDFAVVAGNPARLVRRMEPGVGWIGSSDVRPVLSQAELLGSSGYSRAALRHT